MFEDIALSAQFAGVNTAAPASVTTVRSSNGSTKHTLSEAPERPAECVLF